MTTAFRLYSAPHGVVAIPCKPSELSDALAGAMNGGNYVVGHNSDDSVCSWSILRRIPERPKCRSTEVYELFVPNTLAS